jgi:hypothetical protein
LTTRTFYPGINSVIFSRARIAGITYANIAHSTASPTPIVVDETDQWMTQASRVGVFNGAQFGCYANWSSTAPSLVKLTATVSYLPPPSGFVSLVLSWLPGMIGAALLPRHVFAMLAAVERAHAIRIDASDWERIYRDLQAWRDPRWFDFGRLSPRLQLSESYRGARS